MNTMSIYLAMVRSYEEELVTAETLAFQVDSEAKLRAD